MSVSRFLESKTKTVFHNPRIQQGKFNENTFAAWSNKNFYRTSYNDMSVKVWKPTFLLLIKLTPMRVGPNDQAKLCDPRLRWICTQG